MKVAAKAERVVAEARTWVGTPFHWQASQKGVGCDCKGLPWGVARELGFPEADTFYAQFATYGKDKPVPVALLKEGMAAVFDRVETAEPGDVLLLVWNGKPQHLAICTGDRAIHASIGGKSQVKETRLAVLLKKCRLHSVWRWRDG